MKNGKNFETRGSNKPITTLAWYFNLLKVKFELNPDIIRFPLVLDSPNNAETDDDKKKLLFNFILGNTFENQQLIVSSVGFDKNDYPNYEIDKTIMLANEKYQLLNEKDYQENIGLLEKII